MLRFLYLYGGAGSAKSWALAQYLILEKLYRQAGVGILALRKTLPSVRTSCYKLVIDWLNELGLPYEENKSTLTVTAPGGSFIKFDSIDNVEKKKSIEGINYVWVEEATEFTENDFMQLNLRCRAHNAHSINQLFCSFNPIDPIGNAWLKERSDNANGHTDIKGKPDSAAMVVTHVDNPFLSEEERNQIEALAEQDREYDLIYRQGKWATPTNIIYTNWDTVDSFPDDCENVGYGLDFGFVNPTALVKIGIKDGTDVYLDETLYETGLTNTQLIEKLKALGVHHESMVVADSAEPDRIEEISEYFNVYPCEKGKGSVEFGIDCCKRKRLHITKRSGNVITEIQGYKRKVDRNGNVLEQPFEYKDHAMDAMRYYISALDRMFAEPEILVIGQM